MKPQRLDLTYCVQWQGNWHVGSGYSSAAANRLVRRCQGMPFVPGSLVKGVLRHQCERLVLALGQQAVDPHATSDEQEKRLVKYFRPLRDSPLMVDRLFGTRYQGECLFVDNAVYQQKEQASSHDAADDVCKNLNDSMLRTRTAMDRVTGTVAEQHLFTTEINEAPNVTMWGRLRARHPAGVLTQDEDGFPFEYTLLVASLLSIDALGGDKSAGLGRCSFSIPESSLRWNGEDYTCDEALASFDEHYDKSENRDEWMEMARLIREEYAS